VVLPINRYPVPAAGDLAGRRPMPDLTTFLVILRAKELHLMVLQNANHNVQ
jgi:hypothetical protein